ncbi:unnamed protein product [Brassicogethes aeneus]|uniref:Nudix hydrolase domain-containing protein n=1 Tax=Brassicogethes aeneus TaxID=1431903 RepID=A0A9P0BIM9_BRAAE|nr:unnamed protein product [Brassicogethes aeneus]
MANIKYLFISLMFLLRMVHTKSRNAIYPLSEVPRFILMDNEVPWDYNLPSYDPPEYNAKSIFNQPWADPKIDDVNFNPKYNEIDGKINRKSHNGVYNVKNKTPLNPMGRTGIKGRGRLGRWGPNHAADPIVTRWKLMGGDKVLNEMTNLPILQFCGVQRRDNGQWALPGGMVDPGEKVSETLKREFLEEAMNSLEATEEQRKVDSEIVENFFKNGVEIYKGYVDDPRNTDNAWMETVAVNFHDNTGEILDKFNLKAGDDAKNVTWIDIDKNLDLYASHLQFIEKVVEKHKSHW